MNVNTRVTSAWNAAATKSNIRPACSSKESGIPIGAASEPAPAVASTDVRLGALDAALDLTNVAEIIVQAGAVSRAQLAPQFSRLLGHRIQNALLLLDAGRAILHANPHRRKSAQTRRADWSPSAADCCGVRQEIVFM